MKDESLAVEVESFNPSFISSFILAFVCGADGANLVEASFATIAGSYASKVFACAALVGGRAG
jgi:hypothetical protein